MAVWPATVPVSKDSYKESPPNRAVRSSMDVGPDKVRKRSTAAVREVEIRMMLTDDELEDFDEFFDENETLVFDFTDPRTDTEKRARFASRPTYDLNQTMWSVSVKLEYLP
jgi:hypothetical protein